MYKNVIKERDKFERTFLKILNNAVKELHLDQDSVKMRAYAILGAINWIPRWYSPTGKLSPTQIGQIMADFFICGFEKRR